MAHKKGIPCPWLHPKNPRRTINKDCHEFNTPEEILTLIKTNQWDYKGGWFKDPEDIEKYHKRDRALMSLLFITSGRINEVLILTKSQFKEMKDMPEYEAVADKKILILSSFWVSKRRKTHVKVRPKWNPVTEQWETQKITVQAKPHPMIDIPLPREGMLAPFTEIIEEYLACLRKNDRLFHFKASRAWQIVFHCSGGYMDEVLIGKWNHWFRSQSLSYFVRMIRNATAVAKTRGIENVQTISHYYKGDWLSNIKEIKA